MKVMRIGKITWAEVILFCLADLFVYIILGLLLMGYDDNYNESKGEYWGLASMTTQEKLIYIGFQVWNVLNIIVALFLIYRGYKRFMNN
jgi:hypothetical protein